ncbi:MAG: hypothetical protein C5B46_09595 [Proteobacteria bacterium]|nr:MAG: hypothetical protein C5B46_09595 [Pseudomonadota bacterium]
MRILQEAFTNIVRHAQASAITVRTRCTGEQIMIEISDNGVGVRAQNAGRGIANMHKRARALGGRVDVISSPAGTTVTLSIPRDTECRPDSSTSGERKVESGAALVAA